ncbi:MAG: hypothetical protein ACLFRV_02010 [Acidimicrobiales bacterium]
MKLETIRFAPRYVGPMPGWVNGGVIAGRLAAELPDEAVTVRIDRPVPIDVDLVLGIETADGLVELRDHSGDRLAFAGSTAVEFDDLPPTVTPAAAAATTPAVPRVGHPAPGCFVCGPEHPDGLDLQPGPLLGHPSLATTFVVRDDLAPDGGALAPSVVWAAMDCPGWYAGCDGQMALLGSMTAQQFAPMRPGDEVIVQSWKRGVDGRKVRVGVALRDGHGSVVAASHSIWIMTPDLVL